MEHHLTALAQDLEKALGSTYRIVRELGGGGMSRVFLAEEVGLQRQVVVKVLPPEMAAGVNQDRFRREIQLAARLQHPLGVATENAIAFIGDTALGRQLLGRALQVLPRERLPVANREWLAFANAHARLGNPDEARRMIRNWEGEVSDSLRRNPPIARLRVDARLAAAEGRYDEAIAIFRRIRDRQPLCLQCDLDDIGELFDLSGRPDSAITTYEQLLGIRQLGAGPNRLPVLLRRLGQLYDAKGNRQRALEYYGKFVDLWKDADAVLQPKVEETRRRIAQLTGEPR